MAYAVRHGRTRPRQGLFLLVTSLTTRRNFDGEHAILAGDVTVQLAIGAARVALCSFIFNAGCSLVRHIDVGPVSSQPMMPRPRRGSEARVTTVAPRHPSSGAVYATTGMAPAAGIAHRRG
jgi:hypothetical protein